MDDYGAYYRRVRDSLAKAVVSGAAPPYPEPCELLRGLPLAGAVRRAAACRRPSFARRQRVTKIQIEELKRQGVDTMAALAATPLPLALEARARRSGLL